jgi:hypothetical protein
MVIFPLRNAFIHIKPKLRGQGFINFRTYAEAPTADLDPFLPSKRVLTTWLFDRYTNQPYTLSKWIDMSTLPDIIFFNIIVKFSDEFLNYLRKHHFIESNATIHIHSEDVSTTLTKTIDFSSPMNRKDEYARIQKLMSNPTAS